MFFKQDTYEQHLTDKLKAIKLHAGRFAELAQICSYQKQEVLHQEIKVNRKETRLNRAIIERSRSESTKDQETLSSTLKTESANILQGVADIDLKLTQFGSNHEELHSIFDDVRVLLKGFLGSSGRLDPKTYDGD